MTISFHESGDVPDANLTYVAIAAQTGGKWIFCRHKDRESWEIPGGHIEPEETPLAAAMRELSEETGACAWEIREVCSYSVEHDGNIDYGRLFYAVVTEMAENPHSEIEELAFLSDLPDNLTYPQIQPRLFGRVRAAIGIAEN